MSLLTELGLTGAFDYKYAAPTALPGRLSSIERFADAVQKVHNGDQAAGLGRDRCLNVTLPISF